MVASQHHRACYLASLYCLVESLCYLRTALSVGIQDACLRTYDEVVAACLTNPMYVVCHLSLNLVGRILHYFLHHTCRNLVGLGEVGWGARCTHPSEGTETIVEEHRTHYVLHVRRISELAILLADVGSCALRLQQEGVAIVEEVHTTLGKAVYGSHLSAQRRLHMLAELIGILSHHLLRLLQSQVGRIVATRPRIV